MDCRVRRELAKSPPSFVRSPRCRRSITRRSYSQTGGLTIDTLGCIADTHALQQQFRHHVKALDSEARCGSQHPDSRGIYMYRRGGLHLPRLSSTCVHTNCFFELFWSEPNTSMPQSRQCQDGPLGLVLQVHIRPQIRVYERLFQA